MFTLLLIALLTCMGLAFSWDTTLQLGGGKVPLFLYILDFFCGVVGTTTVVVIWSFMAPYKEVYTSALSTGMGFSGLIPAGMAIVQAKAGFSVRDYYFIFFGILCVSLVSLVIVLKYSDSLGVLREEKVRMCHVAPQSAITMNIYSVACALHSAHHWRKITKAHRLKDKSDAHPDMPGANGASVNEDTASPTRVPYSFGALVRSAASPLFNQLWTNVITYVIMPGMPPFIVASYADPTQLLLLMTLFFMAANTLGRILCGWYVVGEVSVGPIKIKGMYVLSMVQSVLFCYLTLQAILGKSPIPSDSFILPIAFLFCFSVLNGYIITGIYCHIPLTDFGVGDNASAIEKVCRWTAVVEQLGALSGGFICVGLVKSGAFHT